MSEGLVHFEDRQKQLRTGIFLAWIINFLFLSLTIEAALIFGFLSQSSSNEEIGSFLMVTLPISALVGLFATFIISTFSYKILPSLASSGENVEVKQGDRLYNVVEEMLIASGWPTNKMPKVYVANLVDNPNAYAVSWRGGSAIVFTRGLIEILNREEIQAVAAHEMAHITSGDSKAMTKLVAMTSIVGIIAGSASRYMFYGKKGSNEKSNPLAIVLIVVSFIFLLVSPCLMALSQAFMSRKRESQADAFAVQYTRNPTALASALQKISGVIPEKDREEKMFQDATKQLAFFGGDKKYSTHPTIEERIEMLRRMGAEV